MGAFKFKKFYEKMVELFDKEPTILEIMTDTDLHTYINGHLPPKDKVSFSTFEKWKAPNNSKSIEMIEGVSLEEAKAFRDTLAFSRVCQKLSLYKEMKDPNNKMAYKQQWIMERKFNDLKANPVLQLNSNPVFKIEAGNAEERALLDNLYNGEDSAEDIDYEEIEKKRLDR